MKKELDYTNYDNFPDFDLRGGHQHQLCNISGHFRI